MRTYILAECVRCGKETDWEDSMKEPPRCVECYDTVTLTRRQEQIRQLAKEAKRLKNAGLSPTEIARMLKCSPRSVHRLLALTQHSGRAEG